MSGTSCENELPAITRIPSLGIDPVSGTTSSTYPFCAGGNWSSLSPMTIKLNPFREEEGRGSHRIGRWSLYGLETRRRKASPRAYRALPWELPAHRVTDHCERLTSKSGTRSCSSYRSVLGSRLGKPQSSFSLPRNGACGARGRTTKVR